MDKQKCIIYIGNDLSHKSNYHSAYATLKKNLKREEYFLITASSKQNQIYRLLDIVFITLKNVKKTDYILIDTFSTSAFYFAFITSLIARIYKTKYIPILHGGNLPERLMKSKKMSEMIFKNSYINVSPSNYLKDKFMKEGYNTVLIDNTINILEYTFKERKAIKPRLLYVRAFAKIYNPILALRVLKLVHQKYPEAVLCMVGPDRDGTLADVEAYIKKNSLSDYVKLTGVLPKKDWHQLSKNYDVFINTTNVDNTPVSLIETMALGLPIVSTDVGGVPFLVSNNIDGLLVKPDSEKEMSDAIFNLLENSELTNSLSLKGRFKAENMDWDVVKDKWAKILI